MRYAVISDIHGNLPALEAVLEDAARQGADRCLFAGDYAISGPWPDGCLDRIRAIPEKTVIRGNEEKYLENLVGKDPSLWTDGQMQISYWSYRNLRGDNLDYLLSLPYTAEFEDAGVTVRMAHSSVDFLGTYPFWTWNSVTVAERNGREDADPAKILSEMAAERDRDPAFREAVSKLEKGVYIFGHSHIQWTWQEQGVVLINPGSCGIPLDALTGSVPYTLLEIAEDGRVTVEERRIPFDMAAYIRAVRQSAQFREANVWCKVIERELFTAREHMHYFLKFTEEYARGIGDERRPFARDTWERAYEQWNSGREEILPQG